MSAQKLPSQNLPVLDVGLDFDNFAFLIPEIQDLPELDSSDLRGCEMRFRVMPCVLLEAQTPVSVVKSQPSEPFQLSPSQSTQEPSQPIQEPSQPIPGTPTVIAYPLLVASQRAVSVEVRIIDAAREQESFSGLSLNARVISVPEYRGRLRHDSIMYHLPLELAEQFFPWQVAKALSGFELAKDTPIGVNFRFPIGTPWPAIAQSATVKISLSLYARAGGLAVKGGEPRINSLSRPTRIHLAPNPKFEQLADDYYQLRCTSRTHKVTSDLPALPEDYAAAFDPAAAYIAKMWRAGQ